MMSTIGVGVMSNKDSSSSCVNISPVVESLTPDPSSSSDGNVSLDDIRLLDIAIEEEAAMIDAKMIKLHSLIIIKKSKMFL